MEKELRTPNEWLTDNEFCDITIMDPDGWDRTNYTESWSEPITREVFRERMMKSTCFVWKGNQGDE